ncbi:FMN-binding protein [Prevotella sp. E13-17]|uniref:FMN-binding protein n=1 Tax=Prevotella sp. E13-17 TaxID=2913616 RepID=UPI001EDAD608|nr:FMN-binding protein [Prevotella sp. E13-17]UKK52297.1 FMN-binding protein [Prevotella sp. E13-17]
MNTNSNTYIIIYSTVLVLIVAFLLAFVSQSLKPQQDKNVALDQEKQILNSLNLRGLSDEEAHATYEKIVTFDEAQNVYVCTLENGDVKYVLPLKGQGMWGGISAFLSVDSDKNTIYGAYFNHESETAGLGAEIKDNPDWQAKFQGKKIFADESKEKLALSVEKNVNNETTVDAVTGATVTSTAVSKMLQEQLTKKYMDFLKN